MKTLHFGRPERPPKKAIVLVAFGTSVPEARVAYDRIEEVVGKAFPDTDLRWAYTSKTIRKKLLKEGVRMPSPEVVLAHLMDEGYTHVALLSLHIFPGKEFHDLYFNAGLYEKMANGFDSIMVARPLLASYEDMDRTAKALLETVPAGLKSDEGVIFIGHGNERHPAGAMFAAMNCLLNDLSSNVLMATVQGRPSLNDVLPKISARKIKRIILIPFMLVAGGHVKNDMVGDNPESWKSVLTQNGVACDVVLTGIAENPAIIEIWLDHLREVYSAL